MGSTEKRLEKSLEYMLFCICGSKPETNVKKEETSMPSERESNEIKKSMAYDLIQIIEEAPAKENYTAEEIKKLIKTYIITTTAS